MSKSRGMCMTRRSMGRRKWEAWEEGEEQEEGGLGRRANKGRRDLPSGPLTWLAPWPA